MLRVQSYGFEVNGLDEHNISIDLASIISLETITEGDRTTHAVLAAGASDSLKVPSSRHNDTEMARLYRHWQDYKNEERWVR